MGSALAQSASFSFVVLFDVTVIVCVTWEASKCDVRLRDVAVGLFGHGLKAGLSTLDCKTGSAAFIKRLLCWRECRGRTCRGWKDEEGTGVEEMRGCAKGRRREIVQAT